MSFETVLFLWEYAKKYLADRECKETQFLFLYFNKICGPITSLLEETFVPIVDRLYPKRQLVLLVCEKV